MSTLIRIPSRHMRFVQAHRKCDYLKATLSPAKWQVEFVLIANAAGHEKYVDQSRIHGFLAHVFQDV